MKHVTIDAVEGIRELLEQGEPISFLDENNQSVAVLMSVETLLGMSDTMYLQSIPGMVESILAAEAEPWEDGFDEEDLDFDDV